MQPVPRAVGRPERSRAAVGPPGARAGRVGEPVEVQLSGEVKPEDEKTATSV